jgi:hypothetical protein
MDHLEHRIRVAIRAAAGTVLPGVIPPLRQPHVTVEVSLWDPVCV